MSAQVTVSSLKQLIETATGERKADIVIKNAKLVNVLSEEIYQTDIAITQDQIVGLGTDYKGKQELDVHGAYVTPAFIDGHVHLESAMITPAEFGKAILSCGTTTVIADPHEITNVLGIEGIRLMEKESEKTPLDIYFMLPSCVPATPFETSGYILSSQDISGLFKDPHTLGLAEMMNYVGVIKKDKEVLSKIKVAHRKRKQIDGHAPLLSGKDLCAYAVCGIRSDHECTHFDEALEKMRLGIHIMIREGSAAKDLEALLPLLKKNGARQCFFVTDDRHPGELQEHINGMVKRCVQAGISPIKAIQCASLNTAEYFNLSDRGAIAPGYKADLLIFPDLVNFKPEYVIKDGKVIVEHGLFKAREKKEDRIPSKNTMMIRDITPESFKIPAKNDRVKTIQVIENQLITKEIISSIHIKDGYAESNLTTDTLKICVFERHHRTGRIGKGFVKGFQLKSGAIASTVAHDSHNLIVIGTNDSDMCLAAQELVRQGGGKIVVNNGKIEALLKLPIAGLLSDQPLETVQQNCADLKKTAQELGCSLKDPFMTLSFLSLSVIPELKITDKGVFSTKKFDFIDIFKYDRSRS